MPHKMFVNWKTLLSQPLLVKTHIDIMQMNKLKQTEHCNTISFRLNCMKYRIWCHSAASLRLYEAVYRHIKWTTREWHDFSFSADRSDLQQLQSQCEAFHRKIKESIEKLTLRNDQIKALVKKTHHFERQETDANEEVSFHLEYIHLPVCSRDI